MFFICFENSLDNSRITIIVTENTCMLIFNSSKKEDNGIWTFEISSAEDHEKLQEKDGVVFYNHSVHVRSKNLHQHSKINQMQSNK